MPIESIGFIKRLCNGAFYRFMHLARVYKPNFIFGRMNVDIHLIERDFDEHNGDRKLSFNQALGIPLKYTVLDAAVADKSAVYENIKSSGCPPRHFRRTDPA